MSLEEAGPGPLAPGDVTAVEIEKGVYRGLGLARVAGQVVFVPRGLPGERLRVRVVAAERGYLRAEPLEVLASAPGRRPSPCPYVPRCGGCTYQELDYPAQLALKQAILLESLRRAGLEWSAPLEVRPSPEQGWRMRAALHFEAGPPARLGLHEEGSRRVVDLERCLQLSPAMNRAARGLLAALGDLGPRARRVRGVELCESPDGARLVAALETDLDVPGAAGLAPLAARLPWLSGLGVLSPAPRGGRYVPLHGEPFVEAQVLGLTLRCHVRSFFQANRFLVEDLARRVRELAAGDGPVLDLFAGVGLFALPLAAAGASVRGLEINPTAVDDAGANARRAGLRRARFERVDVRAGLARRPARARERVILDPPRTGAGLELVRAVAARRPLCVVYVSCDPPTLGRDLKGFSEQGYVVDALEAFDLFPDTFHLEAVARLVPRPTV